MSPVLKRLRDSCNLDCESLLSENSLSLSTNCFIGKITPDVAQKLVAQHPILNIEYGALCHQVINHLEQDAWQHEQLKKELMNLLLLSELLELVHSHYLNVPREVLRLRQHQKVYRALLNHLDSSRPQALLDKPQIKVGWSVTQHIREATATTNWYRLLMVRTIRLIDITGGLQWLFRNLPDCFNGIDVGLSRSLAYLSWCFLTPRLLTNLFLLFKHLIPWSSMSEEERSLGWAVRLQGQLSRRWFELSNDLVWVTVGIVNCFVLLGALAPIGAYLSVGFFVYDMLLSAIRGGIEVSRIIHLRNDYSKRYNEETDPKLQLEILEFQEQLGKRLHFEIMRAAVHFANTTAVFLTMCLLMPVFFSTPIVPLLGIIALILVTIGGFALSRYVESKRPAEVVENTPSVAKLGLFATKAIAPKEVQLENKGELTDALSPI